MTSTTGSPPSPGKYSFCCMPAMFALASSIVRRAGVRKLSSLPMAPSVTTNVLPAEREVTRVCTFTLPNSVIRHWGIPSVKLRSSSGEGFWWTVRASTSNGYSFDHSTIVGPGRSLVADEGLDSTRGPRPPGCRERATRRAGTDAMELTEEELVEAIRKVLSGELPGVQVGIGDDAAVVGSGTGSTVLTTDMLIEDVHFERSTISARDLGAKSIVVNVSDIAAMAASPRYAMVSLGIPADVDAAWVMELFGGMRAACDEYALALVGGDTNRAGAVVVVTGSLGAAAGGFLLSRIHPAKLLQALAEPWGRELLDAQARPVARVGEGQTLARAGATAMMDLSDGLAKDLSRLCAASGVGTRLEQPRVPVAQALRFAAGFLDVDPQELALAGGEDYELLATIDLTNLSRARGDLHERFGVTLTDVGVIIDTGLVAVDAEGRESPLEPKGWDHFATR